MPSMPIPRYSAYRTPQQHQDAYGDPQVLARLNPRHRAILETLNILPPGEALQAIRERLPDFPTAPQAVGTALQSARLSYKVAARRAAPLKPKVRSAEQFAAQRGAGEILGLLRPQQAALLRARAQSADTPTVIRRLREQFPDFPGDPATVMARLQRAGKAYEAAVKRGMPAGSRGAESPRDFAEQWLHEEIPGRIDPEKADLLRLRSRTADPGAIAGAMGHIHQVAEFHNDAIDGVRRRDGAVNRRCAAVGAPESTAALAEHNGGGALLGQRGYPEVVE
jgi:hypothetical protein